MLRKLASENDLEIFAAYGSSKDVPTYASIKIPSARIFIIGRSSRKVSASCTVSPSLSVLFVSFFNQRFRFWVRDTARIWKHCGKRNLRRSLSTRGWCFVNPVFRKCETWPARPECPEIFPPELTTLIVQATFRHVVNSTCQISSFCVVLYFCRNFLDEIIFNAFIHASSSAQVQIFTISSLLQSCVRTSWLTLFKLTNHNAWMCNVIHKVIFQPVNLYKATHVFQTLPQSLKLKLNLIARNCQTPLTRNSYTRK